MTTFTENEINEIFSFVKNNICYMEDDYVQITAEDIDEDDDLDGETKKALIPLIGYEAKVEKDGEHEDDMEKVNYSFYFKSPQGEVTVINTRMSLMLGWNHKQEEVLK